MDKNTFDKLSTKSQRAYKRANSARKAAMYFGWVIAIPSYILTISDMVSGVDVQYGLLWTVYGGLALGGFLSGFLHAWLIVKSLMAEGAEFGHYTKGESGVEGALIGCIIGAFVLMLFVAAGGILLVIDTVRHFRKKPLVYSLEDMFFIE